MPFHYTFYVPHFLTSNAQIGKTKVFLRAGQMAELDALRTEVLGHSAKKIQSKVRSFLARKKYIQLQLCATQLQAVCRGIYSCLEFDEKFHSPILYFLWPAFGSENDFYTVFWKEQLQEGVMKTFVGKRPHWKFRPATVCTMQGKTM